MHFVRILVAFAVFLLGLTNAEAQTVEDCAAIENKEVRQECFNAAFANKSDPSSEVTDEQDIEKDAWKDIQTLSEILETSTQYKVLKADPVGICELAIDDSGVNVFKGKRIDTKYTIDLARLYGVEVNTRLRFNDTVRITTERTDPIYVEQETFTSDGTAFLGSNSAEVREVILSAADKADRKELLEVLSRSVERCKILGSAVSGQGKSAAQERVESPLIGRFVDENTVGTASADGINSACASNDNYVEISTTGLKYYYGGATGDCKFDQQISQGSNLFETTQHCKLKSHAQAATTENSLKVKLELQDKRLIMTQPELGNVLNYRPCGS